MQQNTIYFPVSTYSEKRHRVTKSSVQVPLKISSLFTDLVPIVRTKAITHKHTQYMYSKLSIINMQTMLAEISNDRIRNYDNPQHLPGKKSKLKTNKVRRVSLLLSQISLANLLEDLIRDIVASTIILELYVLPLSLACNN